jgi:hypothetical protein
VWVVGGSDVGGNVDLNVDGQAVKGDKVNIHFGQNLFAVPDFDGDGNGDVAAVSQDGTKTQVHLIKGGSSFFSNAATKIPDRVTLARSADTAADFVASTDFDANGHGDLVVGNSDAATVYLFFGEGLDARSTSTEADADSTVVGDAGSTFGTSVAVGGITGRASPDLVVAAPATGGSGTILLIPTGF